MIRTKHSFDFHYKNLYKRISRYSILFFWIFIIILLTLLVPSDQETVSASMNIYIFLWLVIVAGFFVFISNWSFSARLGRPIDILEMPVYLGVTSMFLIQGFGLAPYLDVKYLSILPSVFYIPSGLLLTGIGLLSLLFGYMLISLTFKPKNARSLKKFFDSPSLPLTIIVYVGLLLLRLVLIGLGAGEVMHTTSINRVGGDWYQWLVYLIELRWFLIALVTLQVFNGRWPRRYFIILLSIEATMAILSGWSSLLPKIIVLVFGCLFYTRQKLPWRTLLPVAIVVVAIIIFSIPVTREMRSTGPTTLSKVNDSIEATWGKGFSNGWQLFSNLMIKRQIDTAQMPAILLKEFPNTFPYFSAVKLAVVPLTFIPRVIWPSKPVYSDVGIWLAYNIFGSSTPTSMAPTIAGNAYMYGGWSVVIIGMFILGIVVGLYYRLLAIPGLLNNQVGLLAVYAGVVIANFNLGEGDFVGIWQGLVQRTFVFLVMAWFLCRKGNKKG